ncbi:hypothetical protein ACH5RR_011901 [Cinchona calisaya]|uniref:BZIP domain-containing protein n=1 Tax=Cinchona calisaya TaxID=153742 RepID=A0ABD3A9N6_9GENT
MEEVWKDINLSSLQDQPSSRDDPTNTMTTFSGMIFQDFLARPFDKDPQATTLVPTTRYGSPSPAPAPTHPATMLTLNSGPETFHLFGENNSNPLRESSLLQPPHPVSLSCNGNGKKRFPESENNNNSSSDRRHKRMIKNRESAARSRARKQECLFLYDTL